ncbi:tetratricopeptide repeat protein [Altererythrobacter sp. TH136]|nr:tetratricopeptide repeat protein [Altererythrobacter sp. TH136]
MRWHAARATSPAVPSCWASVVLRFTICSSSMISTRDLTLALALLLYGCGGGTGAARSDDWRAALAQGDAISAEWALKRELEAGQPANELAPFLGEAELAQGNLSEARRWLGSVEFAPAVAAHGFHMLGRLRMAEGDLPGAGQAFDRALTGAPDNPELWLDIARLRYRGGEQVQAAEASHRALALGPDNVTALLLRAQMERDAHGNAAALPLLERGLSVAPDEPNLLVEYAATLGELGRANEMLVTVRHLAAVAPGDGRALCLQAVLAARGGRFDLARSLLQRSGDAVQRTPAAMLLLGVLDLEGGNPISAAQVFDGVLRRQPDNRRVQVLLARALFLAGSDRELIARFSQEQLDPYVALLVARAYENQGDRAHAGLYLDRALARSAEMRVGVLPPATSLGMAPTRVVARGADAVTLVRGLIRAGRTEDARAAAKRWLLKHPGSAEAMALAGDAAFVAGDWAGAMRHYHSSAAIKPSWPLTKRMAAALKAGGHPGAAKDLVAAHVWVGPGNAKAAAVLARRSASLGG